MNIFIVDNDPKLAAQMLCDQHVVKMITESAQMLSTAHRVLDESKSDILYKIAHRNHPCTKWVMKNSANYSWLFEHYYSLAQEYTFRYDKIHKAFKLAQSLEKIPTKIPTNTHLTSFVLAMPDEFKCDDPVESYQKYYRNKSKTFKRPMRWTNREKPKWIIQM